MRKLVFLLVLAGYVAAQNDKIAADSRLKRFRLGAAGV
jgi:hypothetical protein